MGPPAFVVRRGKGYTSLMTTSPRRALTALLAAALVLGAVPPGVQAQVARVAASEAGVMPVSPVSGAAAATTLAPALNIGASSLAGSLASPSISPFAVPAAIPVISAVQTAPKAVPAALAPSALRAEGFSV